MRKLILILLLASPVSAADLYVCWNYQPPNVICQTPQRAFQSWQTGDRIWLIGSNFKFLVALDANDPVFAGTATIPYPNRPDIQVILKSGGKITSAPVKRRKGDTSTTAPITVNQSTAVTVETR